MEPRSVLPSSDSDHMPGRSQAYERWSESPWGIYVCPDVVICVFHADTAPSSGSRACASFILAVMTKLSP